MQIAIVLGLLFLTMLLFALETVSADVVVLIALLVLVVTNILTPEEAFAGFSDEIIMILASIFVISGALQQTGVMDVVGFFLLKLAKKSKSRLLLTLMTTVGAMSAFMNNTTTTAAFIPPVMGMAKRAKMRPSKLLMPLAYASILGGTCTLIGTSTNVAVSGYISGIGLEPIGLFELTPIGIIILTVGIIYMSLIGQRLLPARKVDTFAESVRDYLSEVIVVPESHLIGQKIFDSELAKMDFRILSVMRGRKKFFPSKRNKFMDGDIVLVEGSPDELVKIKELAGIEIKSDFKFKDSDLQDGQMRVVEALIIPKSSLIGRTVKTINFRRQYGLTVLAIYRHGQSLRDKIGRIRLKLGDLLLLQGSKERLEDLRRNSDFWIFQELGSSLLYKRRRGLLAIGFFILALLVAGIGWMPLSISLLGAVILLILFRCISVEDAYTFVDWRLIIVIGGMTAFGMSMTKSGAADFVANLLLENLASFGVMVVIAGFVVLTILLTQPMSNAAAALVVLPVALKAAESLQVEARTFAIAIMLAASISLIAPFEPACILVYGPGKYRFLDFIKTGSGLTLILVVVILLLIPVFWPI